MTSMNIEPNSHKYKAEKEANDKAEKKVTKITKGTVKKKRNLKRELASSIISEEHGSLTDYVIFDVLIPAFKKTVSEVIVNGIDMLFWGETGHSRSSKTGSISYYKKYEKPSRRYGSNERDRRYAYSYDDVVLETRSEAEDVLRAMDGIIETYHILSVADYYDLVGVECNYTDNNYGWDDIRSAHIQAVSNGYIIVLPKASPI